jgi:hypothetical protein
MPLLPFYKTYFYLSFNEKKKVGNILVFLGERIDTLTHSTHMPLLPFYKTYKFVGWVLGGRVGWGGSFEQFGWHGFIIRWPFSFVFKLSSSLNLER